MSNYTYYSDLSGIKFNEESDGRVTSWIQLMRHGTYNHVAYGKIKFDPERTLRFAESVQLKVRGVDPDVDYDHKTDKSKGNKAAGWIVAAEARPDGLYGLVSWTPKAVKEIRDGEWRYISPEFMDEWTDNQGKKFKDVLFGAGLTNRPFLKDLLPVNLSELTFGAPKSVDEPPKKEPTTEENEVDPKELREKLGLPADAPDDKVTERLQLIKQLSEAGITTPPAPTPNPTPPAPPKVVALSEELKQLAEANPTVKALVAHLEDTIGTNADMAKRLREQDVAHRLSELDRSRFTLTVPARDLLKSIMLNDSMTSELSEQIWQLFEMVKNGQTLLVELGERGGVRARPGTRERNATETYMRLLNEKIAAEKMGYADAAAAVASENPQLFEEYRQEATAFHA